MSLPTFIADLPPGWRILFITLLAVLSHFAVRLLRTLSQWILTPGGDPNGAFANRYPKAASVITITVSAVTFTIYFLALGLVLKEFGISLTAYLASASVIGLAVGFGLQGLVQDIIIGLTLIFSDVLDVGDMVDISGQTGRVEHIGLRFTTLVNLLDQRVYVPNRNIVQINRYRNGYIRTYVDIQIPKNLDDQRVIDLVKPVAFGMRSQFSAIVLTDPDIIGVRVIQPGNWRYLRIKFRLWPGQGALIENTFKQRVLSVLKQLDATYSDWNITVTYRAD